MVVLKKVEFFYNPAGWWRRGFCLLPDTTQREGGSGFS